MYVQTTKYFLALQDGRADEREWDTKEEAETALANTPEFLRRGMFVTYRTSIAWDSTVDTLVHIRQVQEYLGIFASELILRGTVHDQSKLGPEEKPSFDKAKHLKEMAYGSDEYEESLQSLKGALAHHYKHNSHHPEHYEDGVSGMNLFDLVEMYCDWLAASQRTANGSFQQSLEISFARFKFDPQLEKIFLNTAHKLSKDLRP